MEGCVCVVLLLKSVIPRIFSLMQLIIWCEFYTARLQNHLWGHDGKGHNCLHTHTQTHCGKHHFEVYIDHTHQGPHYWFHFNPGPLAVSESGSETVDRTLLARRSSHGIGGLWPFERPSDGCQGEPAADWNKIPDKAVLSNWPIMTPSDSNCHIYRYKYILSNFGNDALGAWCMNISNVLSGIGHCNKGLRGWKTIPGKMIGGRTNA